MASKGRRGVYIVHKGDRASDGDGVVVMHEAVVEALGNHISIS